MAESDLKARSWPTTSADTPTGRSLFPAQPRTPGDAPYQPARGARSSVLVAMSVTSHHDVAIVRNRLRHVLHGCDPDVVQDVELVTTELLANALEHARPPCGVTVTGYATEDTALGEVVIEVLDGSRELVPLLDRSVSAPYRGRGMRLVRALSSSWGVLESGRTKTVWAAMHLV